VPHRPDLLQRQHIGLLLINHRRQVGQLALELLGRWGITGRRQEQVLHVPAHHLEGGHGGLFAGDGVRRLVDRAGERRGRTRSSLDVGSWG
jgi:hypothetical protein